MSGSIRLGSISGIAVEVHFSWFFIFLLLTFTLALGFFPATYPGMDTPTTWVVSAVSAILLFVAVLVHELSHSFVGRARGMDVQSITLFVFGGVSNLRGEPKSAMDEFLMSVVGPLASFGVAGVFYLLSTLPLPTPALAAVTYLALVNVLLGVFNLIPGFPLDGGRVLRSIIWGATKSMRTATIWASGVGQAVAWVFIVGGVFIALTTGNLIGGIWLALIGFFLNSAAEASRSQLGIEERFQGIRVSDLMDPEPLVISPDATLQEVVERYVLAQNVRALPVMSGGRLAGIITVVDLRQVGQDNWPRVRVGDAMTPFDRLKVVSPTDPLTAALNLLGEGDFHQLPVVRDGDLVGLLTRREVIRFLQLREELGVRGGRISRDWRDAA